MVQFHHRPPVKTMIPVVIYLCKKCKEKDNKEVILLEYEVIEPTYRLKGMFCNRCLTFYVTEGEMDVKRFNEGGREPNLDKIKWPLKGENN